MVGGTESSPALDFLIGLAVFGFQVVVYDLTVAERHVPEMLSALEHAHGRKRRDRAADVRDHEQLCGSAPGALQPDIVDADLDELGDLRCVVVDVGKELEHHLGGLQLPFYFGQAVRQVERAIRHGRKRDLRTAIGERTGQHLSHGVKLRFGVTLREAEDLAAGERWDSLSRNA